MCPYALPSLDALDLPHPRSRPSFSLLKDTLIALTLLPSNFISSHNGGIDVSASTAGVANYLTTLISSPLPHLTEQEREEIWTQASARLSERAGRSGMGALTRTFSVSRPRQPIGRLEDSLEESERGVRGEQAESEERDGGSRGNDEKGERGDLGNNSEKETEMEGKDEDHMLHITIHEPAFTGDNLGLKTWGAAYVLATLLSGPVLPLLPLLALTLPRPASQCPQNHAARRAPADQANIKVLELGAGTGLAGIATAAMFRSGVHVTMTDLDAIVPNLRHNVDLNEPVLSPMIDGVDVEVLDWSTVPNAPTSSSTSGFASDLDDVTNPLRNGLVRGGGGDGGGDGGGAGFDIVLAADSLYAASHAGLVSNAIAHYLNKGEDARVISVMPDRGKGREFLEQLREEMRRRGLGVVDEGWEVGGEDWDGHGCADGGDEGENVEGEERGVGVRFWWAVWRWT